MGSREATFLELGGAVRHLFHQLRAVAEIAAPSDDGLGPSHRGVLESLAGMGPRTVPELARARPVARQHIQVLVDDLLARGLVETRPNPAHKRSPLVALTKAGERRFAAIRAAESEVLATIRFSVTTARMVAATDELAAVSRDLEAWLSSRHDPAGPPARRERRGAT